jgi:hypothetical protein
MRLIKVVLALGIVALVCTPALAQGRRGGGGGGAGNNMSLATLVANKSVQDELKLDADAVKKTEEAMKKVREDLKDDYAKLGGGAGGRRGGGGGGGGGGNNATPEERTAARKKTGEAEDKALTDVLKSDQMKRLHQIAFQQRGMTVFQDETVQTTLKLNDEQKGKIKDINDDLVKATRDLLMQGGGGGGGGGGGRGRGGRGAANPETQTKLQGLRKEAMGNAVKVLNDDQKKSFKDLTGETFEIKIERAPTKPRTDF